MASELARKFYLGRKYQVGTRVVSLLGRYIIREMLGPFFVRPGVPSPSCFSRWRPLLGVSITSVVESKAGLSIILEYLANRLPQVVVFTCPMSRSC